MLLTVHSPALLAGPHQIRDQIGILHDGVRRETGNGRVPPDVKYLRLRQIGQYALAHAGTVHGTAQPHKGGHAHDAVPGVLLVEIHHLIPVPDYQMDCLPGQLRQMLQVGPGHGKQIHPVDNPAANFKHPDCQPVLAASGVLLHISPVRQGGQQAVRRAGMKTGTAGQIRQRHSPRMFGKHLDYVKKAVNRLHRRSLIFHR